jgi:hypothetical protein
MRHHTKDKGDIGVGKVISDLISKGYQVCLPISEHLPFDLVAVSEAMTIRRIQVKYREARNGAVEVTLRASYSDGSGVHTRFVDLDGFDAIAVYCPDVDEVYYVPVSCLHSVKAKLTLRITDPMNNQTKGIKKAKDYLDPCVVFQEK